MIFCGDLSVPNRECCQILLDNMLSCGLFQNEIVVINLEGVLLDSDPQECFWKVYNTQSVLQLKTVCKKVIFNLANNHIYDYPKMIKPMLQSLSENGIEYFGLNPNKENRIVPLEIEENGIEYALFGHCWEVYTKTNRNKETDDHVIDCSYKTFYQSVFKYIEKHPKKKVICCFHWNFDMEELPFPAYKQLAHDLIDCGAEAVIGNHAHVPQEIEMYKSKIIAYGLGNFYMPDGFYFNGSLKYPTKSHQTYVISIDPNKHTFYSFETDVNGEGIVLDNTSLPFVENDFNGNYKYIFKKNRVKKKLTPIFTDYCGLGCWIKTKFCICKIGCLRKIKMFLDKRK